MQEQKTIKTTAKAHKLLKQVAAETGEKQYEVLERLLEAEQRRLTDVGK